jgi:GNAT superfamily N-acetyltransferase
MATDPKPQQITNIAAMEPVCIYSERLRQDGHAIQEAILVWARMEPEDGEGWLTTEDVPEEAIIAKLLASRIGIDGEDLDEALQELDGYTEEGGLILESLQESEEACRSLFGEETPDEVVGQFTVIENIEVREDLRGHGHGTKLLQFFLKTTPQTEGTLALALAPGGKGVIDPGLVRFFERQGFVQAFPDSGVMAWTTYMELST